MKTTDLYQLSYKCILDLATPEGITASSRTEAYGCLFGRDSAITILKLLNVYRRRPDKKILEICQRTLYALIKLQGRQVNIESGEEPGKFIHEYRKDNYDKLINRPDPWYVYPDGKLRNYDSLDSTPLTLIALYRYWEITHDKRFLFSVLKSVEAGLNWIITFGDRDKDLLLEYELPVQRTSGGFCVQSWTDSFNSIMTGEKMMPQYPIAPVEVQGFAWLALKLWGSFYLKSYPGFGHKLLTQARLMKLEFNRVFGDKSHKTNFIPQAVDGKKTPISIVTANPLLLLWATDFFEGKREALIDAQQIKNVVTRAFEEDMFVPFAGIRTMSSGSPTFNPDTTSYHNGSFWPMLNGMVHEGLLNWGYITEANLLKQASLLPIEYFQTPIELYITDDDGKYKEYRSPRGKAGCRYQAWSAAAIMDMVTR